MRNIRLVIAYDGTAYHGFQRQINAITVQQVLEEQLTRLFGEAIRVTGAARTDTGVHAYGQVVNFFTDGRIPLARILPAANGLLPKDITVVAADEVQTEFHARFSAVGKTYEYLILCSEIPDPFLRNRAWHIKSALDMEQMNTAAQMLIGEHDFSAFRAAGGAPVSPIRTVAAAAWRGEAQMLRFTIHGNGFLYHMVRNIVGTLVDVGRTSLTPKDFGDLIESRDRTKGGITAPAQGLYLRKVFYDENRW